MENWKYLNESNKAGKKYYKVEVYKTKEEEECRNEEDNGTKMKKRQQEK